MKRTAFSKALRGLSGFPSEKTLFSPVDLNQRNAGFLVPGKGRDLPFWGHLEAGKYSYSYRIPRAESEGRGSHSSVEDSCGEISS